MPAVDDDEADLALIVAAAREGGRIAKRYFGKNPEVWMKPGASPVSEADYAVDTFLRETLLSARPDYGWLSEETVDGDARLSARRLFVVDPIDGTRGFLQGLDRWCVSIAIVEAGLPIAGVLDCPARQEIFSALPGQGAFKNGSRITVRPPGEHFDIAGPMTLINALPSAIRQTVRSTSHIPSLAYRMAMIADGSLDATFVKPNAHDWDIAAADLILREAGGELLNEHGKRPGYGGTHIRHGLMVAGSGDLLAAISPVIANGPA